MGINFLHLWGLFLFSGFALKILIFLIKLSGMISLLANTSNKELRSIELLRFLGLEVSKIPFKYWLVIFQWLKLSVDFHQTIFKAIDPSLKIDVGGVYSGVLLDVQRKFKSLLYRHNRLFYSNNFRLNKCYYFRLRFYNCWSSFCLESVFSSLSNVRSGSE
jgi:hypothetical protein